MSSTSIIKEDIIKEQILRTSQKLFQRDGLHEVTMEDVANAVGKAKSSLYYYYKSKEEIWNAVMDIEIAEIHADIAKSVGKETTIEQKIYAFCLTMVKSLRKKRALYHIAYGNNESGRKDKYTYPIRRRFVKVESVLLNEILTVGISNGELRKIEKKDQDVLVFVLLSGLKGLEKEMVIENDQNLEPAIKTLSHIIINGLKN